MKIKYVKKLPDYGKIKVVVKIDDYKLDDNITMDKITNIVKEVVGSATKQESKGNK